MSTSPLSLLSSSSRSLEWLGGPGAFLSSTALSTAQLGSLGPIASLTEGATEAESGHSDPSLLPDMLSAPANQIVLDTHAQLETVGHEVAPANGPLHGLTALGETIGLGHLGEGGNLLTDLGGVAANPTDTGNLVPILNDAGSVATSANGLVDAVAAAPVAGNGLVGSGNVLAPVETILNQAVLQTHATLEEAGHQNPVLNAPLHAVTGLGETVGLGHLGEAGTLLTDLSTLPGSVLSGGGLASVSPVLTDLAHAFGAADTLVGSLTGTLGNGGLLAGDGPLAPVATLANSGILNLHTTLETVGHEVAPLNEAIHGLTGLGETIGLGHLGQSGTLLTDVADLPGGLVQGQGVSALSPILTDTGAVTGAAGTLLGGVTGLASGLGGEGAPLGGLLGGLAGDAAGSHPLVDLSAGPATATPAADVAVLSPGTDASHTVQASALTAPAGEPSAVSANLLTGDHIAFPATGATADSLVGQLHAIVPVATAAPAEAGISHDLMGDLGLASLDLGGHAQAAHADPMAHSATTGLHLLGL